MEFIVSNKRYPTESSISLFENNLFFPTAFFFLLSYLSLRKEIGNKLSICLCIIKFSVPWIWLYINNFEFSPLLDEALYYSKSGEIYEGILSNGLTDIFNIRQYTYSLHFLFYAWNTLLFLILGKNMYVSMLANIFLSFVAGKILLKILMNIGGELRDSKWITIFYLLSPSVICWSSFHNLREIFLSVFFFLMLLQMLKFYEKQNLKNLSSLLFSFFIMFYIRFYMIIIATAALFIALLKKKSTKTLYFFIITSTFISIGIIYLFFPILKNINIDFLNIAYGSMRFILTPNPFNVDPLYYFILPDAIFHTVMLPISLIGLVIIYKKYNYEGKIDVLFLTVLWLIIFYAILPESQGPRQRFPISFLFTFCQYEGLLYLINKANLKKISGFFKRNRT